MRGDDYLTKPFGMAELIARLKVAIRHRLQAQGERPVFRTGALTVDLVHRIVRIGETEIKLSPKEYDILRLLVRNAGKVLTHHYLLREVLGRRRGRAISSGLYPLSAPEAGAGPGAADLYLTETGVGYR